MDAQKSCKLGAALHADIWVIQINIACNAKLDKLEWLDGYESACLKEEGGGGEKWMGLTAINSCDHKSGSSP